MKSRIFHIFLRQIGKMREPAKQGELENITSGFFPTKTLRSMRKNGGGEGRNLSFA
ncbi:MAG: hypothetical protein ABSA26_04230 [Thermoguttaceae bacterium]|jgi:hypothetical protein